MKSWLDNFEIQKISGREGHTPRRQDAPARLVYHTTEGYGWPNYTSPPHLTIGVGHTGSFRKKQPGSIHLRQHIDLNKTAYALLHDSGTIETNHMGINCIQIEIVTRVEDNRGILPDILLDLISDITSQLIESGLDIDPTIYPALWSDKDVYGVNGKARMSDDVWEKFNGICAHQHVPGNKHWDAGKLDIKRVVAGVVSSVPLNPLYPRMREDQAEFDPRVMELQGVLNFLPKQTKTTLKRDGWYGDKTAQAIIKVNVWAKKNGLYVDEMEEDGKYAGPNTWALLARALSHHG